MKRLDLLKLRKSVGLSQRELADRLAVQASFLSAIEKGRSRFPEEKIERLKEIVALDDLDRFMVADTTDFPPVPPHTHSHDETDALTQLLKHIHAQAHKHEEGDRGRENDLMHRIDYLSERNDRLSSRVDELREKIDFLLAENYRLKELLCRNGIEYDS